MVYESAARSLVWAHVRLIPNAARFGANVGNPFFNLAQPRRDSLITLRVAHPVVELFIGRWLRHQHSALIDTTCALDIPVTFIAAAIAPDIRSAAALRGSALKCAYLSVTAGCE